MAFDMLNLGKLHTHTHHITSHYAVILLRSNAKRSCMSLTASLEIRVTLAKRFICLSPNYLSAALQFQLIIASLALFARNLLFADGFTRNFPVNLTAIVARFMH